MRSLFVLLIFHVGFVLSSFGQSCTGLCLAQVSCQNGTTTTLSGTVYAPNGVDPLPNVIVYIPNDAVAPFTPGVSCTVNGPVLSGSPLVSTASGVDGTFVLHNVPVGANIPLVIQSGRWRRQVLVPFTTACADTQFSTRFPKNRTEGDIPKIAIATGSVDSVECVLRKVGIDDAEFTDRSGSGRINLYVGDGDVSKSSGGARIGSATPSESTLMADPGVLSQYDVLMLPCEGDNYPRPAAQLNNLLQFANAGGRVYASHYAFSWMYQNPPFSTVANWTGSSLTLPDGPATVDTSFAEGQALSQWLTIVGASQGQGEIPIATVKQDFSSVNPPTQPWLTLNSPGNPVMQFVFDTPVGDKTAKCGRVLFNEYHVENPVTTPSTNVAFPLECSPATETMTPQEKLLEFSLFELTDDGGHATLTPASHDFGSEAIGFTQTPQTFVWTNNTLFAETITLQQVTGDYTIMSPPCGEIGPGQSCSILVAFRPTVVGQRSGTLTISAGTETLHADLSGTGLSALAFSSHSLNFGKLDVGTSMSVAVDVISNAPEDVSLPQLAVTADYSVTTTCGKTVPAQGKCAVIVTLRPATTGSRAGLLASASDDPAYSGLTAQLIGTGVDFSVAFAPAAGTKEAGYISSATVAIGPVAGFDALISISCVTDAPASTCTPNLTSTTPSQTVPISIAISTTSQYTVVGYTGGPTGILALAAACSGGMLWGRRRKASALMRCAMLLGMLATASLLFTGCAGRLPAQNSPYTPAGTYKYVVTATDGVLTHSATYNLTVTRN